MKRGKTILNTIAFLVVIFSGIGSGFAQGTVEYSSANELSLLQGSSIWMMNIRDESEFRTLFTGVNGLQVKLEEEDTIRRLLNEVREFNLQKDRYSGASGSAAYSRYMEGSSEPIRFDFEPVFEDLPSSFPILPEPEKYSGRPKRDFGQGYVSDNIPIIPILAESQAVPEPTTLSLLGMGSIMTVAWVKRRMTV